MLKREENYNESQNIKIRVVCNDCHRITNHIISSSLDIRLSDSYYRWDAVDSYQIIKCLGCDTISFRRTYQDSEMYPIPINDEEYEDNIDEYLYPPRIEGINGIKDTHILPFDIRAIYLETLQALKANYRILTGIGLRAILEAICKEQKIEGNLASKISHLKNQGLISEEHKKILDNIRLLGNDAAHEIKSHTLEQLSVVMNILENLLNTIYILPSLAKVIERKKD
ncbi:DUF4145 domain-containing protein [Actinobacillus pleuropneumoniae]|uniref:DUF4145 domain-containing protein n=1 Tax=Actinobacillus pleuropneumoniae TaxID=715 RepID=UPI003CFF0911